MMFNPLYIHAGVGLGKTHLLQSLCLGSATGSTERKALYLTAETIYVWLRRRIAGAEMRWHSRRRCGRSTF